jgi:membrane protease YdiL (CAAX protease family)
VTLAEENYAMHKSLTLRNNLLIILVWAAVVSAFIFASAHPNKPLMLGVGAFFGVVAGIFQLRAIQESKDKFLTAKTALEVRAAMTSSTAGRLALYTLYLVFVILLLTAFSQKEVIGFGLIAGYAAFALARDCIALQGCISLQRATETK